MKGLLREDRTVNRDSCKGSAMVLSYGTFNILIDADVRGIDGVSKGVQVTNGVRRLHMVLGGDRWSEEVKRFPLPCQEAPPCLASQRESPLGLESHHHSSHSGFATQ